MNVLAFDTCLAACSAAVIRGEALHARLAPMERGHSETLFPMIRALMDEAGLGFGDLDRIAVTRGPGTFTGLRAGIAAARGFALTCGAKVVTATSLEVMALGVPTRLEAARRERGFLVAHDARRGELYVQAFDARGLAVGAPSLASPEAAAALAAAHGLVVGSAAALVQAEADRGGVPVEAALPDLLPDAAHLARLALTRAPCLAPVSPLYLREPDAKPQMDKQLARA